jgi:hypothetical protein
MTDDVRAAVEKIRELSGDIADTLDGCSGPGDELTYRGTLLHELLAAAMVLQKTVLHPPGVETVAVPVRVIRLLVAEISASAMMAKFAGLPATSGDLNRNAAALAALLPPEGR